jgi:hypothetical protein
MRAGVKILVGGRCGGVLNPKTEVNNHEKQNFSNDNDCFAFWPRPIFVRHAVLLDARYECFA